MKILMVSVCIVGCSVAGYGITVQNDPNWTANQMRRRAMQIAHSCQDVVLPPMRYNLPHFGWYIDPYGAVRKELPKDKRVASTYRVRTVEDVINAWQLPYYFKENIPMITKEMVDAWRTENVAEIDVRFKQVKEAKEIDSLVDKVAYIACEYSVYGLNMQNLKPCVSCLNKLVKDKWMLGIFGGKQTVTTYRKKAQKNYQTGVAKVYSELKLLMDTLEKIHKKEHSAWINRNPQQYSQLSKLDREMEGRTIMQAKIQESTNAARAAEARAAAAEAAARDAEAAANRARNAAERGW